MSLTSKALRATTLAQSTRALTCSTLVSLRSYSSSASVADVRPERPRRTLFSVPGSEQKKLDKAKVINADAVVLDLEDGVSLNKKAEAREMVQAALHDTTADYGPSEICARINGLGTDLALEDLRALLPGPRLEALVIPKVESASDVQFVSRMMDTLCGDRDIRILAAIESAVGILNLREIASSDRRLDALIFASEDYCADLEAIRTEHASEMLYARSVMVTHAKAYGLQAIDMVHINFRDIEGLQKECQNGREMGFTGKQAIHPNQIEPIHTAFSPAQKDVDFAAKVVADFEAATAQGKGACVVDGIVVDMPVYKWAVKMTQRAKAAGLA
eukprot:Clim_evm11s108 gene=Clim_evmTU11s108